jgi:hypothetical protein
MADAFRKGVGAPDTEYAFEMELIRPKADIYLSMWLEGQRVINGTVMPNPCMFPRLSVGPKEEFETMIHVIDLLYVSK